MPLVITAKEGDDFYVEDVRYVVIDVRSATDFMIRRPDASLVWVSDEWIELDAGVWVSYGLSKRTEGRIVRIMLNAPGKCILRGELYRSNTSTPPFKKKPLLEAQEGLYGQSK